jgi:hypothetical protein
MKKSLIILIILVVAGISAVIWKGHLRPHHGQMSRREFQDYAASIIRERFPGDAIRVDPRDVEVVWSGGTQLGLQNLYAVYTRDHLTSDDLLTLMTNQFHQLLVADPNGSGPESRRWTEVASKVRPQLMRRNLDTQGIQLVTESFCGEVLIGFVIDDERGYTYVTQASLTNWGKSVPELRNHCITNLEAASAGMNLHVYDAPEKFIGVEIKDGYDAARVLLPGIRRFAAEKLGEPFFAGAPNRDFLIMWSRSCSDQFQRHIRELLEKDCDAQPYPLISKPLKVTRDNISLAE